MPGAEKTEQPTGKRINEARRKGQVANSRELTQAVVLLTSILFLGSTGSQLMQGFENITSHALTDLPTEAPTVASLRQTVGVFVTPVLPVIALFAFGLLAAGSVSTLLQTNFLWASERVGLNFKRVRLNPFAWFQQIFSTTGLFELGKAIFKLLIIGWVAYGFVNGHIKDFLGLAQIGTKEAFFKWAKLAYDLCLQAAGVYLILAIADFLYQRWSVLQSLKMTKEEVKDEMIQQEGNPTIKGAVRGKQRQIAFMRMMAAVPKADVVITNPIHLAVAIQYTQEMKAPKVLAKGARLVAERIVKIAKEKDIPLVQNVPLARALYGSVEVDQEIPPELYLAVAEVLVYIYKLRGKLPQQSPVSQPPVSKAPALPMSASPDTNPQEPGAQPTSMQ